MENVIKNYLDEGINVDLHMDKVMCLSMCYLNRHLYNSSYPYELEEEINKYIPNIFKYGNRVPIFYKMLINKKVENNLKTLNR